MIGEGFVIFGCLVVFVFFCSIFGGSVSVRGSFGFGFFVEEVKMFFFRGFRFCFSSFRDFYFWWVIVFDFCCLEDGNLEFVKFFILFWG